MTDLSPEVIEVVPVGESKELLELREYSQIPEPTEYQGWASSAEELSLGRGGREVNSFCCMSLCPKL